MKNKFFNFIIVVWIICLVLLGIVANLAQKDITEQQRRDMENRKRPIGR